MKLRNTCTPAHLKSKGHIHPSTGRDAATTPAAAFIALEKEKVSALGLKEGTQPSLLSFSKTVGVQFRLRGLEMAMEDLGCVLILESCPFLGCPGTAED